MHHLLTPIISILIYEASNVRHYFFSVIESLTTTISDVVSSKPTTGMVNVNFPHMLTKSSKIYLHTPYQLCRGLKYWLTSGSIIFYGTVSANYDICTLDVFIYNYFTSTFAPLSKDSVVASL